MMNPVTRLLGAKTHQPETFATTWVAGGPTTPSKFAELQRESAPEQAHAGQVIVMFGIFLIGMLGMLGLATDVGFAFVAKRAVQGAADAGAMAGARQIAAYQTTAPTSSLPEVSAVVAENTFGPYVPAVYLCQYIGANWGVVGTCDQAVPSNAVGARVRAQLTVPTFFMRVLPATPDQLRISGYAKARVERARNIPADAPFIVCGTNAWDVTSDPFGSGTAIGSNMNILSSSSPLRLNSAAIGKTFRIHDPQLDAKGNADCSSKDDSFKGVADIGLNAGKSAGQWFNYQTGVDPSGAGSTVDGAGGCDAGEMVGCVLLLPVAVNSPAETGTNRELYVVGFAPFEITQIDVNTHNATLLDDYILSGPGTNNWCRDCGGAVVIRLIW